MTNYFLGVAGVAGVSGVAALDQVATMTALMHQFQRTRMPVVLVLVHPGDKDHFPAFKNAVQYWHARSAESCAILFPGYTSHSPEVVDPDGLTEEAFSPEAFASVIERLEFITGWRYPGSASMIIARATLSPDELSLVARMQSGDAVPQHLALEMRGATIEYSEGIYLDLVRVLDANDEDSVQRLMERVIRELKDIDGDALGWSFSRKIAGLRLSDILIQAVQKRTGVFGDAIGALHAYRSR